MIFVPLILLGDTIRLRWVNGALAVVMPAGDISGPIKRAPAEAVFLTLLERLEASRDYASHSSRASNFAPKVFAKRPDADGYTAREFDAAMGRLFADKQITAVSYGRTGDARQRIARVLRDAA